jgi:[ribosomal protein S18]-alanine N-acetyltransferase
MSPAACVVSRETPKTNTISSPTHYSIRPLRMREALALARWRYTGIYSSYNFGLAASLWIAIAQLLFKLLGTSLYYAAHNAEGDLVGMFSFYPRPGNIVEVGLGMRPDKTGQGAGLTFVRAGLDFARDQFKPASFQLDVAVFNQRARLIYERAGFTQTSTLTRRIKGRQEEYLQMRRPA